MLVVCMTLSSKRVAEVEAGFPALLRSMGGHLLCGNF